MGDAANDDGNGNRDKLLLGLAAAGATFLVTSWLEGTQDTTTSVVQFEPIIDQLRTDVARNSEWIATWPTQGELSGDVRQNERIDFLLQRVDDLEDENDELETRIRQLETDTPGP